MTKTLRHHFSNPRRLREPITEQARALRAWYDLPLTVRLHVMEEIARCIEEVLNARQS